MPHTQKSLHYQLILETQYKSFSFNLSEEFCSPFSSSSPLENSVITSSVFFLKVPCMALLRHVKLSHSWNFDGLVSHFCVTSSKALLGCHALTLPVQQRNFAS